MFNYHLKRRPDAKMCFYLVWPQNAKPVSEWEKASHAQKKLFGAIVMLIRLLWSAMQEFFNFRPPQNWAKNINFHFLNHQLDALIVKPHRYQRIFNRKNQIGQANLTISCLGHLKEHCTPLNLWLDLYPRRTTFPAFYPDWEPFTFGSPFSSLYTN